MPLVQAVGSRIAWRPADPVYAMACDLEQRSTLVGWPLFVGGMVAMLRALHVEEGAQALAAGWAVLLGGYGPNNGFIRVGSRGEGERAQKVPATAIDSPSYFNESIPYMVISPSTAARLGLDEQISHHLLTALRPITTDDVARAREIAAGHPGVFVNSSEDYLPKYALGRAAVTAATVPLALAVLAVAVALVASESRRSHQILVAVGAGPLADRKIVDHLSLTPDRQPRIPRRSGRVPTLLSSCKSRARPIARLLFRG